MPDNASYSVSIAMRTSGATSWPASALPTVAGAVSNSQMVRPAVADAASATIPAIVVAMLLAFILHLPAFPFLKELTRAVYDLPWPFGECRFLPGE